MKKAKEVEILRAEVKTKDAIISLLKNKAELSPDQSIIIEEEVINKEQVVLKKCKKCKVIAANMQGLQLNMENDHQDNMFNCEQCNKEF